MKAIDVWHRRQVGTVPISDVAYGSGQFVAVGGHSIFTSATGDAWTDHPVANLPGDAVLFGVAFCEPNQHFVAFYTRSWNEIPPPDPTWAIQVGADGNVLGAPTKVGIWTNRILADGNLLVAVGLGIMYSEDGGCTWHRARSQTPLFNDTDPTVYLSDVCVGASASGTRQWLAVGWHKNVATDPTSYELFWITSDDGKMWQGNISPLSPPVDCVAYGDAAYVASDNYYTYDRFLLLEPSKVSWSIDESYRTTGRVNGLTFGADMFVAVGDGGNVYVSKNGQTWDSRIIPSSGQLHGVRYCGDTFIAFGDNGEIFQTEQCSLPFLTVELLGAKPATVRVRTKSGFDVLCSHSTGLSIDTTRWGKSVELTASGGVGREMKQHVIPGHGTVVMPGTTWLTFFDHWAGAASGRTATTSIIMDADKAVAGVFTYRLRFPPVP